MYAIIQTSGRQVRVTPGGFATLDGTAGDERCRRYRTVFL